MTESTCTRYNTLSPARRATPIWCVLLFYADKQLVVTSRMTEVFQYLEHQAQYNIERIREMKGGAW